jgi:hypothetical protein
VDAQTTLLETGTETGCCLRRAVGGFVGGCAVVAWPLGCRCARFRGDEFLSGQSPLLVMALAVRQSIAASLAF